MNFRPELAEAVMAGQKTVTRRLTSRNPRSPWYQGQCGLRVGKDYAVCPGRGKPAIGRIIIRHLAYERLGCLDEREARLEGFPDPLAFERAWRRINGSYDPNVMVWRVKFQVWPEA